MVKNGSSANEHKQIKDHLIDSCEESKKKSKSKETNNESSHGIDTNYLVNGDTSGIYGRFIFKVNLLYQC